MANPMANPNPLANPNSMANPNHMAMANPMANPNPFLGFQMTVFLGNPKEQLTGTISGVEAGVSLTLTNVWSDTQPWRPQVIIDPNNIVEIFDANQIPSQPSETMTRQQPVSIPQAASQVPPATFSDPAILSYRPRSTAKTVSNAAVISDANKHANMSEKRVPEPLQVTVNPAGGSATREATTNFGIEPSPAGTSAADLPTLRLPAKAPSSTAASQQSLQPVAGPKNKSRHRTPRHVRNGAGEENTAVPSADPNTPAGRGKGWRQTPILQSTSSFQPFNSLRKRGGRAGGRGRGAPGQDNGWASEDVTDVQDAGDFDFEGSLAKFDKHTIFKQMRKDDTVEESERLVSHNRQSPAKPGTAGGKNLHYSENVLDLPSTLHAPKTAAETGSVGQDFWNSEADDGATNRPGRTSGLGSRQGSRRGESKVSNSRRSQSRKTSAAAIGAAGTPPARVNSGVSASSQGLRGRISRAAANMDPPRAQQASNAGPTQGFYLKPSGRRIESISPLQMLNLENIAHNEIGLTEDMMTENCGRGIAEVALTALGDPAIKMRMGPPKGPKSTRTAADSPPSPTVVVLAGNNKSGIRAIAAARHLRNKGVNVLACVVGIERGERDLLEDMKRQVHLYRNFGGQISAKTGLFEALRKVAIPTLTIDTPRSAINAQPLAVTLIIDALLGLAVPFEELRTGDQATVYELIEWANRNEAFALAIDVPTGIDPFSGKVSIVDGQPLYVRPRYVIAMGAPKRGLLDAMTTGQEPADGEKAAPAIDESVADWKLFIADMGLGASVWKKAGTKLRRGVDFDNKWVLEMEYRGIVTDEE